MNDRDQTRHFEEDLNRLIERYRQEYEITVAAIVGTLTSSPTRHPPDRMTKNELAPPNPHPKASGSTPTTSGRSASPSWATNSTPSHATAAFTGSRRRRFSGAVVEGGDSGCAERRT